jgi:Phosphotransferase enzyme family
VNPPSAARPLASGREADVFALDETRVLRRYRRSADATAEAEVMAYVRGLGYPVPAVYRASGPDLVMERLDGPTMTQAMAAGAPLSAVIVAQVAVDAAHPYAAAAGTFLDAFLPLAPGDPVRLLDEAVGRRAADPTMAPDEIRLLTTAAARVRGWEGV